MTHLDGYQFIDDEWKSLYYIEYVCNYQGLISTLSNYNNFDGIVELCVNDYEIIYIGLSIEDM
ncbi:MAG: hypothetical protein UHK52_09845 [Bacteroidales bacterium]|nr:hypothetical protein [Bacteroidales bacterium]